MLSESGLSAYLINRLSKNIRYAGDPEDLCWEWTRSLDYGGYGKMKHEGRTRGVHKVVYEELNGVVPDGLVIMHSCDNKICFRPEHLSVGTYKQNMQDMAAKGLGRRQK